MRRSPADIPELRDRERVSPTAPLTDEQVERLWHELWRDVHGEGFPRPMGVRRTEDLHPHIGLGATPTPLPASRPFPWLAFVACVALSVPYWWGLVAIARWAVR